ncbi:MAG: sugar ABC transporter permease [Clostridia bacterium]|nr:sugar ABC transporter permease [Clostridia bacterium]
MSNTKAVGSVASSSKPKKTRRPASLDKRKAHAGWFFVAPFVIGFLLIYVPIIFDSIKFSFHEIDPVRTGGYTLTWVGFQNYQKALFENADFVKTLVTGIQQLVLEVPSIVIFSLFIAVLLNDKIAGRAAFRAILFVPVILSTGLISSIEAQNNLSEFMDASEGGIDDGTGQSAAAQLSAAIDLEALFANMKVGTELVEYVASAVDSISSIINRSGVQILIFLAGLQSISPAIYESCKMDGATTWETFWKITFPMISPMILVNAVYTIIDAFTAESNAVMQLIDSVYSQPDGNVLSSAMAWMYFLVVILILAAVSGIMSAFVFYQRRD